MCDVGLSRANGRSAASAAVALVDPDIAGGRARLQLTRVFPFQDFASSASVKRSPTGTSSASAMSIRRS